MRKVPGGPLAGLEVTELPKTESALTKPGVRAPSSVQRADLIFQEKIRFFTTSSASEGKGNVPCIVE